MSFFLAIDSGGTKTDYLLADETRELARVRTGTIKRMRTDADTAGQNLNAALAELTEKTGISMARVTRTCVGTAGETVSLVTDWLRKSIGASVGGGLLILGDVEIALEAAFPGQIGVLVMAGTGSNVVGRTMGPSGDGVLSGAGGYGPTLSDQGSGYRIGFESLRAIFLARDEGRSTTLWRAVLDYWQLPSPDDLVGFAHTIPAPDFSKLTGVVVQCAEEGDEVAARVLRQQAEELAYLVRLVFRRLRLAAQQPDWTPPLAYTGSILENVPVIRNAMIAAIRQEFPQLCSPDHAVDPLLGALWRARTGIFS